MGGTKTFVGGESERELVDGQACQGRRIRSTETFGRAKTATERELTLYFNCILWFIPPESLWRDRKHATRGGLGIVMHAVHATAMIVSLCLQCQACQELMSGMSGPRVMLSPPSCVFSINRIVEAGKLSLSTVFGRIDTCRCAACAARRGMCPPTGMSANAVWHVWQSVAAR